MMRRVPQETVLRTEYPFRTGNACFLHRMPLKMRRVPQEPVLSTARIFRTIEGSLRYRMPQTAERRRALPAANSTTARKEEPGAKSAARLIGEKQKENDIKIVLFPIWGAMWGSNPRHPEPQSGALPTELIAPFQLGLQR